MSDLLQYCQGSCGETYAWEDEGALVKGYILNFDDDSIKPIITTRGKSSCKIFVTGMFMEIRVTVNKDPVFEKIWPATNKDIFYIKELRFLSLLLTMDNAQKGWLFPSFIPMI
ncbi:MAG: hypothetical protein R2764_07920 [Bacteroidales bacterium]